MSAAPSDTSKQRYALPRLLCARCRKAEASLGDKIIRAAKLGWVCDACRRQG